ncbi:MAG TPA: hypothetical protein PLX89_20295 [Verrucomicrobiota bacterium]|nr:hypothetical protein [Verrucomicrobiota bacterium]
MIDSNKLISKGGLYQIAPGGGITDPVLLEVAGQYQAQIRQKFLAVPAKELAQRFAGEERLLQTIKYDGEGVFIYFEAGKQPFEVFAFNAPSGRVRVGLPALQSFGAHLKALKVKRALFRAELYLPGQINGRRNSVSEVARVSFNGSTTEIAALRLAILDVIMVDGKDLRTTANFETTWDKLKELAGTNTQSPFHCPEGSIVPEREVDGIFKAVTKAGAEGLVLRRLGRLELIKVKPQLSVDGAIIGFVEGEFEGRYGVLSLLTALTYPEKEDSKTWFQVLARVGSGFTDQLREELLQQLAPLKVAAPLAMTDSDGRPVQFIKPQLIAEVEGDDAIVATRLDQENQTQLLAWDGRGWTFTKLAAFPRLTFATYSKLRTDKDVGTGGARITQVVPQAATPPSAIPSPSRSTRVIRREVYKKESKGETMIRKLVVAQTEGDPDAMPFSIFWTDFSAKRKDPLKISTAYAHSSARAEALAQRFIEEGVAKGWEQIASK